MNADDRMPFFELIDTTYELIGKTPAARVIGPAAKAMMFEDLERFPLELIRAALRAHRSDPAVGHFTPSPAHIIAQIDKRRTVLWVSADEAWSMAPKIEGMPALMTTEMAAALAAAAPLLADGDKVAARMAFKACYDRLIDRAKLERRPPQFFVSPGGSYEDQQAVVEEGVRKGLLPAPAPQPVLVLETTPRGPRPDLKALLLSLKPKDIPPPEAKDYE